MKLIAFFLVLAAVASHAQNTSQIDALTESQQRAPLNETDFQYKFNPLASLANNTFGSAQTMFENNVPSLATLTGNGIAQAVINLNPCAIWNPHNHPRANEILYVSQGSVRMGFQEENQGTSPTGQKYGGRLFNFSTVDQGSSVVVPQALTHYIWNPTCKQATIVSSFDNKDPGTSSVAQTLFRLPSEVIAAATGLDPVSINLVQKIVATQSLVSFDAGCLTTCGLPIPAPGSTQAGSAAEAPATPAATGANVTSATSG